MTDSLRSINNVFQNREMDKSQKKENKIRNVRHFMSLLFTYYNREKEEKDEKSSKNGEQLLAIYVRREEIDRSGEDQTRHKIFL